MTTEDQGATLNCASLFNISSCLQMAELLEISSLILHIYLVNFLTQKENVHFYVTNRGE